MQVLLLLQIELDPRYTALPERRCRQLFNQYHSTLKDLQPIVSGPSETLLPQQSPASPAISVAHSPAVSYAESANVTQLEQEVAAVEEAVADTAMQSASAGIPVAVESNQTEDALELLRQEQAQMKREYDRMQVCYVSLWGACSHATPHVIMLIMLCRQAACCHELLQLSKQAVHSDVDGRVWLQISLVDHQPACQCIVLLSDSSIHRVT